MNVSEKSYHVWKTFQLPDPMVNPQALTIEQNGLHFIVILGAYNTSKCFISSPMLSTQTPSQIRWIHFENIPFDAMDETQFIIHLLSSKNKHIFYSFQKSIFKNFKITLEIFLPPNYIYPNNCDFQLALSSAIWHTLNLSLAPHSSLPPIPQKKWEKRHMRKCGIDRSTLREGVEAKKAKKCVSQMGRIPNKPRYSQKHWPFRPRKYYTERHKSM